MDEEHKPRRSRRWFWSVILAIVVGVPLLLMATLQLMMLKGEPIQRHEAEAVSVLTELGSMERMYANSHKADGFTCDLAVFRTAGEQDYSRFFKKFTSSGVYTFQISGCQKDANAVVTHYQATAVPTAIGRTGMLAFCTDDSDVIRYDENGSAADCLRGTKTLQ